MKIAQVAPLYESVPPKYYGGTERVVSYLTEELVNMGHDVTLFASGDSETKAKLISPVSESLRLDRSKDPIIYHTLLLEKVLQNIESFDIVHFHIDCMHFPLVRRCGAAHVTTLHGRLDLPDLLSLYKEFYELPVVSISNSQREPLPKLNYQGTVYHGLPKDLYNFNETGGKYLAFLGRISPEKRPDRAIKIARKAGIKLKIAAKVDKIDKEYFNTEIKPLLKDPKIEFIGEIGEKEKGKFLGNALALLFPIDWLEPFGLVMIEAFACGTPIIAYRCGSVPEIVDDTVTGFIVDDIKSAVKAVGNIEKIDRRMCRKVFENRFSVSLMAKNYLKIYNNIIRKYAVAAV